MYVGDMYATTLYGMFGSICFTFASLNVTTISEHYQQLQQQFYTIIKSNFCEPTVGQSDEQNES